MGTELKREHFTRAERQLFQQRLHAQLAHLAQVLSQPGFSDRARSLGAELELCLIDRLGRAFGISDQIVRAANTPVITPEMGNFDIELSTPPVAIAGAPFSAMRESMQRSVLRIASLCEPRDLAMMMQRLVKTREPLPENLRAFAEREWQRPSVQAFVNVVRPAAYAPNDARSGRAP